MPVKNAGKTNDGGRTSNAENPADSEDAVKRRVTRYSSIARFRLRWISSTGGTPPRYTRQLGSGYGGTGAGMPNRSRLRYSTVGVG
jgi:hypothetical protein